MMNVASVDISCIDISTGRNVSGKFFRWLMFLKL